MWWRIGVFMAHRACLDGNIFLLPRFCTLEGGESGPTHAQRAFFSWRPSGAEDASRECGCPLSHVSPPSWLTGSVPGKGEWRPPTRTAHQEESTRTRRGGPPSSGAQVAAPIHTPLSSPPVPWCSATLLLGDNLLQPTALTACHL